MQHRYLTQRADSNPAGHSMASKGVGAGGGVVGGDDTVEVGGCTLVGGGVIGGEPGKGRMVVGSPFGSIQVSGMPP